MNAGSRQAAPAAFVAGFSALLCVLSAPACLNPTGYTRDLPGGGGQGGTSGTAGVSGAAGTSGKAGTGGTGVAGTSGLTGLGGGAGTGRELHLLELLDPDLMAVLQVDGDQFALVGRREHEIIVDRRT